MTGPNEPPSRPRLHAEVAAVRWALLLLALAAGCLQTAREVKESTLEQLGIVAPEVLGVTARGPYLEARFKMRTGEIDFLFPSTQACHRVLHPGAILSYSKAGIFGRMSLGPDRCDAVGTMSLARWRDRMARRQTGGPAPTDTARFQEQWRDEQYIFVRGRFPLVNRMGVASYDLIVALPNVELCQLPVQRGQATIQYARAGPKPYRLISGKGQCILAGIAIPPAGPPPASPPAL